MKNRARVVLAAAAGLTPMAAAQPQVATYQVRFGNGSSVVNLTPGQSTTVTVRVSINPGIGGSVSAGPLNGSAIGINDGAFSLSAEAPAGVAGAWSNRFLHAPYNWLSTSTGTLAGLSVNEVYWGSGFLLSSVHPLPANPATVWTGTFTAAASSGFGSLQLTPDEILPTGTYALQPAAFLPFASHYDNVAVPGTIHIICYPDCNTDTQLTIADFGCYQTKFILGDPYADCNGSTTLTVADFGCFQTKFVAGCP